jgi:hypothetical protein
MFHSPRRTRSIPESRQIDEAAVKRIMCSPQRGHKFNPAFAQLTHRRNACHARLTRIARELPCNPSLGHIMATQGIFDQVWREFNGVIAKLIEIEDVDLDEQMQQQEEFEQDFSSSCQQLEMTVIGYQEELECLMEKIEQQDNSSTQQWEIDKIRFQLDQWMDDQESPWGIRVVVHKPATEEASWLHDRFKKFRQDHAMARSWVNSKAAQQLRLQSSSVTSFGEVRASAHARESQAQRLKAEKEARAQRLKAEKKAETQRRTAEKEAQTQILKAEKTAQTKRLKVEDEAEVQHLKAEREAQTKRLKLEDEVKVQQLKAKNEANVLHRSVEEVEEVSSFPSAVKDLIEEIKKPQIEAAVERQDKILSVEAHRIHTQLPEQSSKDELKQATVAAPKSSHSNAVIPQPQAPQISLLREETSRTEEALAKVKQ